MSPTLSTGSTKTIPIENSDNEEETKSAERPMTRGFFEESRIPENSVTGVSDGQSEQGYLLSDTEEVLQPLTESSQSSRIHSARPQKFARINPGEPHLLDAEKLSAG